MRNESSTLGAPTGGLPDAELKLRRSSRAPALITRMRFQYPVGLILSLGAPLLAHISQLETSSASNVINTAIGVFAAVTIGYYAFRRIADYPTLWPPAASVTPVFSIAFLLIVAWFFLLRVEYSRFQFVFGYGLAMAWFMGVSLATARVSRPRFALVPLGDALSIRGLDKADWLPFEKPGALPDDVNGVVVDAKADFSPAWEACLAATALAGTPIYDFRVVREAMTGRLEVLSFGDNVLAAHDPNGAYLAFKRFVDFITAFVALVLLSPLLLVVGVLVRRDSPGPALFRQTRVKRGGEMFTVYKFRTMAEGCADPTRVEDAITRPGDQRITRLGQFLRRNRIDELPQLYNVLIGDMSWIGPRPEAAPLVAWYRQQLPMYAYRHIVPPGITGWAQVHQGHVTDPSDVLEKLHYDFYYIKHFSLWLDLLIVFRTLAVIWTGFGAR